MFLFAFWVISTQKCEAANFHKFKSAGIPIRPFKYLGMSILIKAHVTCMHTSDMHAHHDVTRFAYDANHITMMSLAFVFHLCHIGMMWDDIIGVWIVGTPC